MEYEIRQEDEATFRYYKGEHFEALVEEIDDDTGYLVRIDVDEGFRGQGIGSAAIRDIATDYRHLYTAADNEDAARLYDRLGERIVGEDVDRPAPLECLYYLDQGYGVWEIE